MNLSKQSRELMLFFSKNKNILLRDTNHSNKTKNILRELYNEIVEADNYAKKQINYKYIGSKKIQSVLQITKPQNFNSKSFPEIVRNHINESMIFELSYSFSLYDRNINEFLAKNEFTLTAKKTNNEFIYS